VWTLLHVVNLVGWSVDWLVGQLIGWLVGQSVCQVPVSYVVSCNDAVAVSCNTVHVTSVDVTSLINSRYFLLFYRPFKISGTPDLLRISEHFVVCIVTL